MDKYSVSLLRAVEVAIPAWMSRCLPNSTGIDPAPVASEVTEYVIPKLKRLFDSDVDAQSTTPLAIMREATAIPTRVLHDAGVAPVERDDYSRKRFPNDVYNLMPASWADVDESLVDPGIAWGAAKAMQHKARHK